MRSKNLGVANARRRDPHRLVVMFVVHEAAVVEVPGELAQLLAGEILRRQAP